MNAARACRMPLTITGQKTEGYFERTLPPLVCKRKCNPRSKCVKCKMPFNVVASEGGRTAVRPYLNHTGTSKVPVICNQDPSCCVPTSQCGIYFGQAPYFSGKRYVDFANE